MNKLKLLQVCCLALLIGLGSSSAVLAAATEFTSPNFTMQSLIFGGTGILRTTQGVIPPIITDGPVVSNIQTTSAEVKWTTDRPSNSVVLFGTEKGKYPRQAGELTDTSLTVHDVTIDGLLRG